MVSGIQFKVPGDRVRMSSCIVLFGELFSGKDIFNLQCKSLI